MAFDGYIEFDGSELINISRTVQLAQVLGLDSVWIEPSEVDWIDPLVAQAPDFADITTAPWYDAGYPASAEFAGFIPLGFPGMDDSTLSSTAVEYITDGGHSGKPRNATQAIVASVAVMASTERGADYGKRWLDRRLRGTSTTGAFCSGAEMRFFRWARQGVSDPPPRAHYRDVRLTRGASVTRKRHTDCSATWLTTFTLTANDPFVYGEPELMVTGLGTPLDPPALPYPPGQPERVNLAINPSAETNATGWSSWAGTGGAGTQSTQTTGGVSGNNFRRHTWTVATTSPSGGLHYGAAGSDTGVTPGMVHSAALWVRSSKAQSIQLTAWGLVSGVFTQYGAGSVVALQPNVWTRVKVENVTLQVGATAAQFRAYVAGGGAVNWAAGDTFDADAIIIEPGATVGPYFDGNSAPYFDDADNNWKVYGWAGATNNSASNEFGISAAATGDINEGGQITMVQEDCPVYDYSPIYDPLYPALVPAPQPPDFYPDGWFIESGLTFVRRWVRLDEIEPSDLRVVPVINLTTDTDARGVRVSIWSEDSDFGDQCGPLFTAIVSYLPAGLTLTIDGEAQVAYVWDGFSEAVRRADSLVFGTDATPMNWTAFNEGKMLVTLDTFLDGVDEQGDGTVRAEVAFVAKSD